MNDELDPKTLTEMVESLDSVSEETSTFILYSGPQLKKYLILAGKDASWVDEEASYTIMDGEIDLFSF